MSFKKVFECQKCNAQFPVSVNIKITDDNKFEYYDSETNDLLFTCSKVEMPCRWCDGIATDTLTRGGKEFGWKSQTEQTRRRQREFQEKGMPKEWANNFYKDSIAASKERIEKSTSEDFYKAVDPHIPTLVKQGRAKKTKNVSEKVQKLKNINIELHKMAKKTPKKV